MNTSRKSLRERFQLWTLIADRALASLRPDKTGGRRRFLSLKPATPSTSRKRSAIACGSTTGARAGSCSSNIVGYQMTAANYSGSESKQ
jgi:hypothetical protein